MNKIVSLPLTARHRLAQNGLNSIKKRYFNNSTHIFAQRLTSNYGKTLFHHPFKYEDRNFSQFALTTTIRNFATQNPSDASNRSAAGGSDDDHLYEDDSNVVFASDEEEPDDGYATVPSTSTVPEFFPKVPMIATHYPVFPKFMKVFEVSSSFLQLSLT